MQTKNQPTPSPLGSKRIISLDVFRGLTIAGMIVVNDPGSWKHVYSPLRHAEWNGVTPTDLVFPFFLFIVGVSITLAYSKRLKAGTPKKEMIGKIIRRSLTIFVLGLFLNLFPEFHFADIRVAGVLPRIAIVFFVCALLFLNSGWKFQAKLAAGLLLGYWVLMCLVPTPGFGKVMLEPGANMAAWVDSFLLPGRMYQVTWDPEGVFSSFPAVVTGIMGMLTGRLLISKMEQDRKLVWMFAIGFLWFVAGGIWNWFFPINKNLWSSSYVMHTSGLAAMAFATSIWFVDIKGYTGWTKLGIIFGANAITAYVLHGVLSHLFVINIGSAVDPLTIKSLFFDGLVNTGLAPKFVSMMWAILYTLFIFIPVWILYKRKIFIKI